VICPECGAGGGARAAAAGRQRTAKRWAIGFGLVMAPSCCLILVLSLGWFIGHILIRIRNPNWVQDGEHPILDLLGSAAKILMLPGVISAIALPAALPIALTAQWRVPTTNPSRRWRRIALLLALSIPALIVIAIFRPLGGPPLGIVDWMPD
jgi:hypothetical protein